MTFNRQKVRLDSIAKINPKRSVTKGLEISFVDMAAVPQYSRNINVDGIEKRIAKGAGSHFKNGDTLLARITPCLENGKTAQVNCLGEDEIGEGSTEFIVLCGIDEADNDYIHYICREPSFREYAVSRMEGTSGRQRVSWQSIAAYEFFCPPERERRAAAKVLSAIDERINLLRNTNTTLTNIVEAIFKSWFVNFDPVLSKKDGVAPKGIDEETASLFTNELVETTAGLIPKGWLISSIGDVVSTHGGATPDTKNPDFWEPAIHGWTSPKDLSGLDSYVLLETERKISDSGLKKISSGLLPAGTLLMSSRAPIGYLAIAQMPIAINQGYIAMTAGGTLSPLFMLFWCKANMELIKGRANGSTFLEISKKVFRPIQIVIPPKQILDLFDEQVISIFNLIVENEKKREVLKNIRDTILPRLISGQLNTDDAELESITV